MPRNHSDVKLSAGLKFLIWVDCHPRTGWYLVGLLAFNTALNLIDVLK